MTPDSITSHGQAIYVFGKVGGVWKIHQYNLAGNFVRTIIDNFPADANSVASDMATDGTSLWVRVLHRVGGVVFSTRHLVTIASGAESELSAFPGPQSVLSRGTFYRNGNLWVDFFVNNVRRVYIYDAYTGEAATNEPVWNGANIDIENLLGRPQLGFTDGTTVWVMILDFLGSVVGYSLQTAARDPTRDFLSPVPARVGVVNGNRIYIPDPGQQSIVEYTIP